MNVVAGRIANRFNFGGANYTVDAACASSLAAIYLAVRDLEARTSDVVVAGGVDAIQSPFGFLCFSKTQALSPNGRSRPFDADADGIAISEGFAAVVLKRLEDAERDGDRIYAVIKGVGSSSDGRARGLTAPLPDGQVRAFQRAYANARFSPSEVELIEAHGTGTVAGDQSEIESLSRVFGEAHGHLQDTAVGSVKSMIGHTKATAGVAGLVKVTKALHHRVLPPTLGVTTPNPKANFEASPFYVNTEARPWVHAEDGSPRRAGVSAFGFGGTNFHVALEEYSDAIAPQEDPGKETWPAELLLWRGESEVDLLARIQALLGKLELGARPRLADLAYSLMLQSRDGRGTKTLAIVAETLDGLKGQLEQAASLLASDDARLHTPQGIHFAEAPLAGEGKTAFLFPGQGSQYLNMARELAVVFPEARAAFDRADKVLANGLPERLSRYIFPPPWFDDEREKALQARLTATDIAQPALGVTSLAMLQVLASIGLKPDMTAGHSYGEFVALHAAGVLSEEALLQVSEARGRFMAESTGPDSGAMAAIAAAADALGELLSNNPEVNLANLNSPRQTVISGPTAAIERAVEWAAEHKMSARRLPVACAFHSPLVRPAQERLAARMHELPFDPPKLSVFSNTTATLHSDDAQAIREQLAQHLSRPVEFVREIEAMYAEGARVFVEVGPRQVLSGLVGQILGERPHIAVPLDNPSKPGLWPLLNAFASMAAEGAAIDTSRLYRGRAVRRLDIARLELEGPTYSATTWMVSGGGVRPIGSEPRKPVVPLQISVGNKKGIATPDSRTDALQVTPAEAPRAASASSEPAGGKPPVTAGENTFSLPPAGSTRFDGGLMQHFQQVMQHFLHSQEEVMTGIFTAAQTSSPPAPTGSTPAVPAPRTDSEGRPSSAPEADPEPFKPAPYIRRFLPTPTSIPGPVNDATLDPSGVVVIIDGGETASRLQAKLGAKGFSSVLVTSAASTNASEEGLTLSPDADSADVERLYDVILNRFGRPSALLYLSGLDESNQPLDWSNAGSTHEIATGGVERLFWLAKTVREDLSRSADIGAAILGVTTMGGDFGFGSAPQSLKAAWLPGFLKSLAQEWTGVRVKALDVSAGDSESVSEHIFKEIFTSDGLVEVGYGPDGTRQRIDLVETPVSTAPALSPSVESVVLVTGGARGITATSALALANCAPATFVLVGRTELPEEPEAPATLNLTDEREIKRQILEQLRASGVQTTPAEIERHYSRLMREREVRRNLDALKATGSLVFYEVCDIQDADAFAATIDRTYERFGRIDYVVHGAGLIEDRLLQDKSLDSFRRVLETKVKGAVVLASRLRTESLRSFVMFSSITGRLGNRGQVDYAAANEVLNKIAQALNHAWPGRVVALNWGPWDSTGMVSPEVERQFAERGVALIPAATGSDLFVRELLSDVAGPAEVVIGGLLDRPSDVSPDPSGDRARSREAAAISAPALPVLSRSSISKDDGVIRIARTLSTDHDLYLRDHVMEGRAVQPFAVALETMVEAAKSAAPHLEVIDIREVRVLNGIVLNGPSQETNVVVKRRQATNGDAHRNLYDVSIESAQRVHYRAVIEMGTFAGRASEIALPTLDLESPGMTALPVTLQHAYRDWLFHGPLFQAIESVESMGPAGARATLRRSDPKDCIAGAAGDWLIDPILLDAALQLQLIWGRIQWDVTLLPARVQRYVPFKAAQATTPGEIVVCEMHVRPETRLPLSHTDFYFFNAKGDAIGAMLDFEGSGSAALNRLANHESRRLS